MGATSDNGKRRHLCNVVNHWLRLLLRGSICKKWTHFKTLLWRHNGCDDVSNHQAHDCLLNRSCKSRSKKTSKLRVTGLCAGNSPLTDEFPAQMASNAEKISIMMTSSWLCKRWSYDMQASQYPSAHGTRGSCCRQDYHYSTWRAINICYKRWLINNALSKQNSYTHDILRVHPIHI